MIILYNPPSSARRKPVLPTSLLAVGAVLEGRHDYLIVDGNMEQDPPGKLDKVIREARARILAVTVMPGPQLDEAVPACRALKAAHPSLTVVWGGYFPTQHWEACLRAPYVDYVVRGYGETVFLELIESLEQGGDPSAQAGVAYRDANTREPRSNPLPPMPHPERLPEYPYHRIDMQRYLRRTFMGRRTLSHHSSYGCPFTCNFCAVVNFAHGRWLAQSAERTADTVGRLVRSWGADAVEFHDNNFFTSEARTAEFSERILADGLEIGWWGEARVDTLLMYSERTWDLMRRSGLRMVFMGAESGSDGTLERMNKGGTATVQKTLELAGRMSRYGIVPEMSFILGSPPDPESDFRKTIELVRKLKRANPDTEIIFYIYTPVPLAGDLYEQAESVGFRFPETLEEWVSPDWRTFSQRRSSGLPWVGRDLRSRMRNFESVLNAYYPTATNPDLVGLRRMLLRAAGSWRYHLKIYSTPLELRALQRLMRYQRPETTGF